MEGNYMLPCLVFFPMVGALAAYGAGRKNKTARDYMANAIVILEFAVMLYVFCMHHMAWQLRENVGNSFFL